IGRTIEPIRIAVKAPLITWGIISVIPLKKCPLYICPRPLIKKLKTAATPALFCVGINLIPHFVYIQLNAIYPLFLVFKLCSAIFAASHVERPPVTAFKRDNQCRYKKRQDDECIEQQCEYDDACHLDQYDDNCRVECSKSTG